MVNNVQVSPEEQQIVRVSESGRQIFQNKQAVLNHLTPLDSRTLDYPLTLWQISVYGVKTRFITFGYGVARSFCCC